MQSNKVCSSSFTLRFLTYSYLVPLFSFSRLFSILSLLNYLFLFFVPHLIYSLRFLPFYHVYSLSLLGVFTQALKDAGFNNANASETVTVKDATPKDEKVKTICDVIQIISGVTPTEGNTPPFGTALGNAVATAPSVSPDKNVDPPKAPLFSLPEISLPGGGGFGLPVLPKGAFVIPALFDDGLSHLDPPVRHILYHMNT